MTLAALLLLAGTAPASASPLLSRWASATALPIVEPTFLAGAPADSSASHRPTPVVRAWQMGLARPDRLRHASLSLALAAGIGVASNRPRAGIAAAVVLGVIKESWDARGDRFDPVDLAADVLGAAIGGSVARAAP